MAPEKLRANDLTGVQLLVKTLGGIWGKTSLEDRYEKFERAIYGISQRPDESNESYLARHEVVFEDLLSKGSTLEDVRAYILLRNSTLSADDKKRVIIEAKGNLKYATVTESLRNLGAKFFLEVQGAQKSHRSKTYDVNYVQDGDEQIFYGDDSSFAFAAESTELPESVIEQLLSEGDEDALVVQQFEDALIDTMQNDPEMTAFMGTYIEARRKLTEKSKSRGFWPVRSKGGGKKGKGKNIFFKSRKPLATRIAESDCRLCGQRGHWKAECPRRHQNTSASSQPKVQSANVMISVSGVSDDDADVFMVEPVESSSPDVHASAQDPGDNQRYSHSHECYVTWSHNHNPHRHKGQYYAQVCQRLHQLFQSSASSRMSPKVVCRESETPSLKEDMPIVQPSMHVPKTGPTVHPCPGDAPATVKVVKNFSTAHEALFATSRTLGILDLGASQTVMGQYQLEEFLSNLPREVRDRVYEQPVENVLSFWKQQHCSMSSCHLCSC